MLAWLWLKKSWEWCKIHWKFFLGISIPIIVSIILRKGNIAKVYKNASETKTKQLKVLEATHDLETRRKDTAQKDFINKTSEVLEVHEQTMEAIAENKKNTIKDIDTVEEATAAIKDKLDS